MFLAAIIKTHADAEQNQKPESEKPEAVADASPATVDADASWPSFKPHTSPGYFGRTGVAAASRARWT